MAAEAGRIISWSGPTPQLRGPFMNQNCLQVTPYLPTRTDSGIRSWRTSFGAPNVVRWLVCFVPDSVSAPFGPRRRAAAEWCHVIDHLTFPPAGSLRGPPREQAIQAGGGECDPYLLQSPASFSRKLLPPCSPADIHAFCGNVAFITDRKQSIPHRTMPSAIPDPPAGKSSLSIQPLPKMQHDPPSLGRLNSRGSDRL